MFTPYLKKAILNQLTQRYYLRIDTQSFFPESCTTQDNNTAQGRAAIAAAQAFAAVTLTYTFLECIQCLRFNAAPPPVWIWRAGGGVKCPLASKRMTLLMHEKPARVRANPPAIYTLHIL